MPWAQAHSLSMALPKGLYRVAPEQEAAPGRLSLLLLLAAWDSRWGVMWVASAAARGSTQLVNSCLCWSGFSCQLGT